MAPKSVLITGCSEGTIGNALAQEFARYNWHVYATARKTSSMNNLSTTSSITLVALDIGDRESVIAARDQIAKDNDGKLDILYHNAGYRALAMAIDKHPKDDETYINEEDARQFDTNVLAVMAATRIFAPLVIAAKGTIAFTGSVAGILPMPSSAAYNATKAALEMYTKVLRLEMAPLGVKVVHVFTGTVRTNMTVQRVSIPEGSVYERVAPAVDAGWDMLDKNVVTAEKYAKYVVKRVASSSPPRNVWAGGDSGTIWLVDMMNMRWVLDMMMSSQFGMKGSLR